MLNLKKLIFDLLNDDSKTLVFTSEVVARSWLRKFSMESGHKTVFLDRAISWDKFKIGFVNPGQNIQINNIERQIFANKFIKENFEKLTYFSSKYKESILPFASAVAGYLPFFAYADEQSAEAIHDIKLIVEGYKKYLEENNLFEYNFLKKDYSFLNKNYVLVFPETFNDPIVDEISDKCTVVSTKEIKEKTNIIHFYKNSLTEIRSVIRSIVKDLDSGKDPNGIAITCACIDQYRPYLEEEAKKHDVELCFTSSISVIDSAQGRLFAAIYRVVDESYSFDSVKSLLLDPAFPFNDVNRNRNLINSAVRLRLKNYGKEEWIKRLQGNDNLEFFINLSDSLERVVAEKNIDLFTEDYLNKDALFFTQNNAFVKCKALLEKVESFELFLQILKNETYVDSARNGIRVYKYPVSAALAADTNYVIGLDDKNTAVLFDKYPYLPTYKKNREELEKTIKTEDVLDVYTNSQTEGRVVLCGTKNGFDGARLLPITLEEKEEDEISEDLYETEKQIWLGNVKKAKLTQNQKNGYETAKNSVLKYEPLKILPSDKLQNTDISASGFSDFARCPYMGYISIYLKPKQLDFEPANLDPRIVGNILHYTIQKSLEEVKTFANLNEQVLTEKLKEAIELAVQKNEIGPRIYQNYMEKKYSRLLSEAAKNSKDIADATLYKNEVVFEKKHKIEGLENVCIKGRIDTVLTNYDGYVIIDYKTTNNNNKNYSKELEKCNLQLAIYAQILEDNIKDSKVVAASYYIIDDNTMRFVWPQETVRKEDVETVLFKKEENLKNSILNSSFDKTEDEAVCASCYYSGICRGRYTVK